MSKHLFGLIVTPYGTAANNRGETEGNLTTLQKILWKGEVHTTVSAEAIRWALRYYWQRIDKKQVNRVWNEETSDHEWQDQKWTPWTTANRSEKTFIDDDVLGFMLAEAAKNDSSDSEDIKEEPSDKNQKPNKKPKKPGTCDKRRGALEVTRAISLSPFQGDITFNAKSGKKGNTSLYATEMHATRYQYGFALSPEYLRDKSRITQVIRAIIDLSEVAGNHSRFLYDFSPDSVVFRWTNDFAPRMLYSFKMDTKGNLSLPDLIEKVKAKDIAACELYIGGSIVERLSKDDKSTLEGATIEPGVKNLVTKLEKKIKKDLDIVENVPTNGE